MRARVAIVAVALAAGAAAVVVLVPGGESAGCDARGRCHGLRGGAPTESAEIAGRVAGAAIDSDPSPGFSSRCRFRGVARGRVDVFRCAVGGGVDGNLLLHLEHPRESPWYRYRIVEQRGERHDQQRLGERGDCQLVASPYCPAWSAYGERLAKALRGPRDR